jgi:hypothetical protein
MDADGNALPEFTGENAHVCLRAVRQAIPEFRLSAVDAERLSQLVDALAASDDPREPLRRAIHERKMSRVPYAPAYLELLGCVTAAICR